MLDPAFDDFLDSDDDEFFIEASNHLLDNDLNLEFTSTRKEGVLQNLSEVSTSSNFKHAVVSSPDKLDVADISTKSSSISENADKNASDATTFSSSSKHQNDKTFNELKNYNEEVTCLDISTVSNKTEISISSAVNISENLNKDKAVATTSSDCNIFTEDVSSDCNIFTEDVNSFKVVTATPANSSYIDSRFTPGFTPKAKKRKILGPAGFLEFYDASKETTLDSPNKMLTMDMEFQNIVSSQYTPEHLSLPSWQKLQTTVSSCPNLHSTAKYYSIQRVLSESSKKKLPKHMVVPVLCVLLKKFSTKGPAVISVFMDDTGEINGKIDAELLSKYKEFLVEGTALILKKVTFLCNVLILKDENLVSLYHPQGTEKHPQTLESILETSEPLKPMNCECLKLSHKKKDALKSPHYNASNHHTSKCVTHSQNRLNSVLYQSKGKNLISQNNNTPRNDKSGFSNIIQNRTMCVINQNNSTNKSMMNTVSKQTISAGEVSVNSRTMRNDEFLEQLLEEDNCMDEFDEMLGNLDEKSFMEDI